MSIHSADVIALLPEQKDSFLCSDHTPSDAALILLHSNMFKKRFDGDVNLQANKAALEKFKLVNARCECWEPNAASYYYDIVEDAKRDLHALIHTGPEQAPLVSLSRAMQNIAPGPGSTQGTRHTDFLGKVFDSRLTTYSLATYKYYVQQLGNTWKEAELIRYLHYGPAVEVECARMSFAKKEFKISRVINTEANVDMMIQKGLGACLEEVLLKGHNIDLSKQPSINRLLAKLGSIDQSFATIDLASASDSISVKFAQYFLPPGVFRALSTVRSPLIEVPPELGGEKIVLNTFSTMGNGFTFPLQTLIFASLVKAVYRSSGYPVDTVDFPHYSVFGDDIIVANDLYYKTVKVLEYCGFQVNGSKSFHTGGFRESCGEDYFKGCNVRPVFCKELSHDAHVFSLFNRLSRWSLRNGIDISAVLGYLWVRPKKCFRVPFDVADDSGFKVPLAFSNAKPVGVARFKMYDVKKTSKSYSITDSRLLVAALGGYADGGCRPGLEPKDFGDDATIKHRMVTISTTLRSQKKRYRVVRGVTSSWDFIPHQRMTTADYTLQHLAMLAAM